jgi:hypothetical protein
MGQGFGKPQRTKLDILSESAIKYCQQRYPEALDNIFDNHSSEFNHQLCHRVILALDIDAIAWFCGYLCSEINTSNDNNKPYPVGKLSAVLISQGMELFEDFTPYPGQRLLVGNPEKFRTLPQELQDQVNQLFEVQEKSTEEAQQIHRAILQNIQTSYLN